MDPDFFTDYPPHPHALDLQLPPGYTYLLAKGFSAQQMVLLLQRAKIVLDLGTVLYVACTIVGWVGSVHVARYPFNFLYF